MIKVYQQITPDFFAPPKGEAVDIRKYHHVANVETASLDQAYESTNTIRQQWWENEEVTFLGSPKHGMEGCRSTSVGDIMQIADGSFWVVSDFGFTPIEVTSESITMSLAEKAGFYVVHEENKIYIPTISEEVTSQVKNLINLLKQS